MAYQYFKINKKKKNMYTVIVRPDSLLRSIWLKKKIHVYHCFIDVYFWKRIVTVCFYSSDGSYVILRTTGKVAIGKPNPIHRRYNRSRHYYITKAICDNYRCYHTQCVFQSFFSFIIKSTTIRYALRRLSILQVNAHWSNLFS